MLAHRVETIVQNGQVTIGHMPFHEGEKVEVIVLSYPTIHKKEKKNSLAGMPLKYIDPFGPTLPEGDWNIYK